MKLEFSRAIIMNQGMPPYKGKKVVYYEDPRFKNKAFLEIPNMEWIRRQIKSLPSNKIKHKDKILIAKTIKEVKSVSISRQGLSTKEKYSKVTLWWKGHYLNK